MWSGYPFVWRLVAFVCVVVGLDDTVRHTFGVWTPLDVESSMVLKVGDSLSKDIKGVNKPRIDTAWILFDDGRRSINDPEPTYTRSSLGGLPEILVL